MAERTAFDTAMYSLSCPECGKDNQQRLAKLISCDTTPCVYCGHLIDLTDDSRRASLAQEAEIFKKIKCTDPR